MTGEEALLLADKIYVMNEQKIIQQGTPKEVMENPTNTYVANFLGCGLVISGDKLSTLPNKIIGRSKLFYGRERSRLLKQSRKLSALTVLSRKKILMPTIAYYYYFKIDCNNK